jgi:response regulator RpfG family c-di-GMP phosphodiesterase
MKGYVLWSGRGPLLVVTTAESPEDPDFVRKLLEKGIERFIATPVSLELIEERYGERYHIVLNDRRQSDILRVVDEDGDQVARNFSMHELGPAEMCEAA